MFFFFLFFFFVFFFSFFIFFFFFNDTATTEIYTLSLHDALPIRRPCRAYDPCSLAAEAQGHRRSEEHTSELQSRPHLVCRLLLEKKKNNEIKLLPYTKKKKKKHEKTNKRQY